MTFDNWIYQKYTDWRENSRKSMTTFAQYLGVHSATLAHWMDGTKLPQNYTVVVAIAAKYPDVYQDANLPLPYSDDVQVVANMWSYLPATLREKILEVAGCSDPTTPPAPKITFSDWIYRKFYEWRGMSRANKTASQYARYMGLPISTVTCWLNGQRARTTDYRIIATLARKYPDVYRCDNMPLPYGEEIQQIAEHWTTLPENTRREILELIQVNHLSVTQ